MNNQQSLDRIFLKLTELEERFEELDARLDKMEEYLERQKGFIGGVLFLGTCIAGIIPFIKDWWK